MVELLKWVAYNVINKDSMDNKKQIEQLYADALYNDEPPNVFADRILSLFGLVKPFYCHSEEACGLRCDTQCLGCDGMERNKRQ